LTARHYIPEHSSLHNHRHKIFKSQYLHSSPVAECLAGVAKQSIDSAFWSVIKIYLLPQCDQKFFVWQKFLDQPTSATKPSPRWRKLNEDTAALWPMNI
jgi:hypothetical protein